MRDDSAEILFRSFLQEALVSIPGMDRDVHSLMLSIQHFLCRPWRRPSFKAPWRMVLERLSLRVTCPNQEVFSTQNVGNRGRRNQNALSWVSLLLRMNLWRSSCTLYLPACQVRVTVGDSGLCCCVPCYTSDVYTALLTSFLGWFYTCALSKASLSVQGLALCPRPLSVSKASLCVQGLASLSVQGLALCPRPHALSKASLSVQGLVLCPRPRAVSKASLSVQGLALCPRPRSLSDFKQMYQRFPALPVEGLNTASRASLFNFCLSGSFNSISHHPLFKDKVMFSNQQ